MRKALTMVIVAFGISSMTPVPTIRDHGFLDVTGGKAHHLGHSLSEGFLATKPEPTGSTTPTNTIGRPRLTCCKAITAGVAAPESSGA